MNKHSAELPQGGETRERWIAQQAFHDGTEQPKDAVEGPLLSGRLRNRANMADPNTGTIEVNAAILREAADALDRKQQAKGAPKITRAVVQDLGRVMARMCREYVDNGLRTADDSDGGPLDWFFQEYGKQFIATLRSHGFEIENA